MSVRVGRQRCGVEALISQIELNLLLRICLAVPCGSQRLVRALRLVFRV